MLDLSHDEYAGERQAQFMLQRTRCSICGDLGHGPIYCPAKKFRLRPGMKWWELPNKPITDVSHSRRWNTPSFAQEGDATREPLKALTTQNSQIPSKCPGLKENVSWSQLASQPAKTPALSWENEVLSPQKKTDNSGSTILEVGCEGRLAIILKALGIPQSGEDQNQNSGSSQQQQNDSKLAINTVGRQQTISTTERLVFHPAFFTSPSFRARMATLLSFVWRLETEKSNAMVQKLDQMSTDEEIINELKELPKTEADLEKRLRSDKDLIGSILHAWNFTLCARASRYLDIGCNFGTVTEALGDLLYLDKSDVFGIDVSTPSRLVLDKENYMQYDGTNIPFPKDRFDFISIFMVLHHVESDDLHKLLTDVERVIQRGGYLLLKEHNCDSVEMTQLIDLQHMFYSIARESFDNPGNYRSTKQWDKVFESHNFKPIKFFNEYCSPTNSYYRLYISCK